MWLSAAGCPGAALRRCAGALLWLLVEPRTPGPRRAGVPREPATAIWGSQCGMSTGTQVITCPGYSLTLPAARRIAGAAHGGGSLAACLGGAVRSAGAELWDGEAARWGARGSRSRRSRTSGSDASPSRWASLSRWRLLRFRARIAVGVVALPFLCRPASPVAGLLLALVALHVLAHRALAARGLVIGAPAAAVAVALALLFPGGGLGALSDFTSFLATVAVVAGFLLVLPSRAERALRVAGLVYLGVCVLSVALHTPMGANVERYGLLLGAPAAAVRWARAEGLRERQLGASSGLSAGDVSVGGGSAWSKLVSASGVQPVARPGVRVVRDRRVDPVGPGAGDGRGGRGPFDGRRLLRAVAALPGLPRGRARARGGAVHARALGGRLARAHRCRWRAVGRSSWTPATTSCCCATG